MTICYVLARFPKVSQTFVSGEIGELVAQGEDVRVMSLRRPSASDPVHAGVAALSERVSYLRGGPRGTASLVVAAVRVLVMRPQRAVPALAIAIGCAIRNHTLKDLLRFTQASAMLRVMPAEAEHIHAHFAHGPAATALLLSRLSGVPFSFTAHAHDIYELTSRSALQRRIREAAFVVGISEHGLAHMRAVARPEDRWKITLVRNGIEPDRFAHVSPHVGGRDTRIVAVSRLIEKKGLDTLIEATELLIRRGHLVKVEIVGDGPQRDELTAQVRHLGLVGRVFLLGSMDEHGVDAALSRATLFVLPCRRDPTGDQDGLPVSIVEAMCAGLPVISTPVSGVPEVVRPGENGLLVPPEDPHALADAIERLITDPVLHERLSTCARGIHAEFDRTEWVAVLREWLHGTRRRSAALLLPDDVAGVTATEGAA